MKGLTPLICKGFISVLLVAFSFATFAQHDHGSHNHGSTQTQIQPKELLPPHGGQMKKVGKYQIEMVVDMMLEENQLMLYLYKNSLKPLPINEITGTITKEYNDGSSQTDTLQASGDYLFLAQAENKGAFYCIVRFFIKGKIVSTIFTHDNGISPVSYSCVMHPDVKQTSQGKCPLCGMELHKE